MLDKQHKSALNLLLACENSKYRWFLREREGYSYIILSRCPSEETGICITWKRILEEDENPNSALINFGEHKIDIKELEKTLGVESGYFEKIDCDNYNYFMKPNVNAMILDGIVEYIIKKGK